VNTLIIAEGGFTTALYLNGKKIGFQSKPYNLQDAMQDLAKALPNLAGVEFRTRQFDWDDNWPETFGELLEKVTPSRDPRLLSEPEIKIKLAKAFFAHEEWAHTAISRHHDIPLPSGITLENLRRFDWEDFRIDSSFEDGVWLHTITGRLTATFKDVCISRDASGPGWSMKGELWIRGIPVETFDWEDPEIFFGDEDE
jgi:hypothetical protein